MKKKDMMIARLEAQVRELTLERNSLRNTFLAPKKKPFDAPEPDIEITYDGRIPCPFIGIKEDF